MVRDRLQVLKKSRCKAAFLLLIGAIAYFLCWNPNLLNFAPYGAPGAVVAAGARLTAVPCEFCAVMSYLKVQRARSASHDRDWLR